jgi:hypothetical protein
MKNVQRAKREREHTPAGLNRRARAAMLAAGLLAAAAPAGAQTSDMVAQRQVLLQLEGAKLQAQQTYDANLQKAETDEWPQSKVMINLDARCPVATALGFFGAYASTDADPAKAAEAQARFAQLLAAAQPMAQQLMKLATSAKYVGLTFPPELEPQLSDLRGQLYAAVAKIYGDAALGDLQRYVAAQVQGSVVGPVPTAS